MRKDETVGIVFFAMERANVKMDGMRINMLTAMVRSVSFIAGSWRRLINCQPGRG